MSRKLLLALPLLAGCAHYATHVTPTAGAPTLAPLPQAEVVQSKPATAGSEVARIDAQGSEGSNPDDCKTYLASEAAKIGAPVVVMVNDAATQNAAMGPHCAGIAYAPGGH